MTKDIKVRMNWLKGMYIYTIVAAGGFGLGMILMPEVMKSMLGWPGAEPIAWGIVGTIYIAFRILSIFGLCSPLKFVPILFLQLCYKSIWLIGVILPLLMTKQFPNYALSFALIFATFIIGDIIAIPFSYIFTKEQ